MEVLAVIPIMAQYFHRVLIMALMLAAQEPMIMKLERQVHLVVLVITILVIGLVVVASG